MGGGGPQGGRGGRGGWKTILTSKKQLRNLKMAECGNCWDMMKRDVVTRLTIDQIVNKLSV